MFLIALTLSTLAGPRDAKDELEVLGRRQDAGTWGIRSSASMRGQAMTAT